MRRRKVLIAFVVRFDSVLRGRLVSTNQLASCWKELCWIVSGSPVSQCPRIGKTLNCVGEYQGVKDSKGLNFCGWWLRSKPGIDCGASHSGCVKMIDYLLLYLLYLLHLLHLLYEIWNIRYPANYFWPRTIGSYQEIKKAGTRPPDSRYEYLICCRWALKPP